MSSHKGTRSMSWLNLPKKIQKEYKENVVSMAKDMEKYVCKDFRVLLGMVREMWFSGDIDIDNSNIEYLKDWSATLTRRDTPRWNAYVVHVTMPGFPSTEMFSAEIYNHHTTLKLKSDWNVLFRWAFFRFRELMKEQVPTVEIFYNEVVRRSGIDSFSIFRRNQVDVAIDIKNVSVDQGWNVDYIVPHKTSNCVVKPFNFKREIGWYQSFNYFRSNNRGIWVRIYNKVLDIIAKNKYHWYPDIDTAKDTLTRIEIVFYSPFSENSDSVLFGTAQNKILGLDTDVTLCDVI